jgi:GNAT superfamily N-acetyltransferase
MRCKGCGTGYGRKEINEWSGPCKGCDGLLDLEEFWSCDAISDDLAFARSRPDNLVLLAEAGCSIAGFVWGYALPLEKFQFLAGLVSDRANYMDDIAVRASMRGRGVGSALGAQYLKMLRNWDVAESILRTDRRNPASMGLFARLGYAPLLNDGVPVLDPEYPERIYLRRWLA